jgi:hypothetical protein
VDLGAFTGHAGLKAKARWRSTSTPATAGVD